MFVLFNYYTTMEKLIELLNEFQKEKKSQIFYSYNRDLDFFESWAIAWCQIYWESVYTIISKKFWFIKWLVENDKIDISKIKCWYVYNDTEEDKVKNVIMNLSISDSPIEDLVSILK